jgi:hypothetical protein
LPLHSARTSFTVPATSGQYATQRIQLAPPSAAVTGVPLYGVTALIESAPAGAVLELWLMRVEGDPATDASFFYSGKSITTGAETWTLAGFPGAQIRVRSGGTGGTLVASATAD